MQDHRNARAAGWPAFLAGLLLISVGALFAATLLAPPLAAADTEAEPEAAGPPAEAPVTGTGTGPVPVPVPELDLRRFAGTWYVIATIPDRFHEACAAAATITYTLQPDRRLRVQNRCRASDDSIHLDEGTVRIRQPGTLTSRLEVRYTPDWLGWLPLAWSEVWVIALADDYGHVLTATPDGKRLWILSRSPVLAGEAYERIREEARAQGFDPERLVEIPQEGGSATSAEDGVVPPAP